MEPASRTETTPSASATGRPPSVTAATFSAGTSTVAVEPTGTSTRSVSVAVLRCASRSSTGPYGVRVLARAHSSPSPVTAGAIVIER